ncbi:MAG: 3-sulfinopropanoyl-CoA desulfinase [Geminicoccaceae bacterium]|jgi:alkylation response protein AidB-like acyl-CoA dehydrogenase|nr:acyl-CoA dehydrogenase family protein [Hyphomonas sp.]
MSDLTALQTELQSLARRIARDVVAPRAAEIDRTEAYPWATVEALTAAGLMGMTIPTAYGGQGLGVLEAVLVVEELARVCGVTGRIAVEGNLGAVGAIMAYGTEAQKKLAAGLVLAGDKPAICITEPEAGSAATEMRTTARRRGDSYVLDGSKTWITGGGVSKLHLIFARVLDEAGQKQGIGGFIAVAGEQPGLEIGRRLPAMGLRGLPETEIHLNGLTLPADRLLLPPDGLENGFRALMRAYNSQRTGAAAVALGIAQGAFDLALAYVGDRRQFGRPLAAFQGLQWMLADMSVQLEAARLLVHQAATSAVADRHGFPDMAAAARAKLFAAEMAQKVTNDALQLFGANGYGRDLPLERMVRDARMFTIGGGTAQILRNQLAGRLLADGPPPVAMRRASA